MKRINKKYRKSSYFLIIFIVLITQFHAICFAQKTKPKSEAEIRILIKKTLNKNTDIADEARNILINLDTNSIPIFISIMSKKGDLCERVEAARTVLGLYLIKKEVASPMISPLVDIVVSNSVPSNSQMAKNCRYIAADLLPYSSDGIRALTQLLKHKSLFVRQTAISVFGDIREEGDAPKDSLQALQEAIPVIASAAREKNEIMKNMAYEVLNNLSNDETELGKLAKTELNKLPK